MLTHLWQSTIFAAVVGLLTLALRKNHARTRHWIWLAASIKFLIPFSVLVSAASHVRWPHPSATPVQVTAAVHAINGAISQPFQQQLQFVAPAAAAAASLLPVIWLCGFTGVLFFWYVRWRRVHAIVRAASPIDLGTPVRTMSSPALLEPGVFGIFRPVLLLPEGIVERLTPRQLRAIIDHELCHIRRRDNLAAAIHMVVESIFWFHPLVWWIGSRLVDERERACDEEVLRQGSEPEVYAEGILNVCKFYVESPLACVSGVTGSDLKKRIEAIMTHRIVCNMGFGRKLILATVGIVAILLPVAIGILNAQSPAPHPHFEVASIKPNVSPDHGGTWRFAPGGRIVGENVPVKFLIMTAYRLRDSQISGTPAWADSEKYDIEAKAEGNPGEDQITTMLQGLLADRFKLEYHEITKELPVYALVSARSGIKLQTSKPGSCIEPGPGTSAPAPGQPPPALCGYYFAGGGHVDGTRITMAQFVVALGLHLDRPVIDKTGFTPAFDAHLKWSPDESIADGTGDNAGPSMFTAIQEQLGLKLESTKGPVQVLVVDHVERPSEN